jgi:hypothetical protein
MVRRLAAIAELPACTLDAWSVYEVPLDGPDQPWTRHFVGFKREGCRGQVSSPVEQFDPASRRGRTRSGKQVYELAGESGLNGDAFATWGQWKVAKAVDGERDITEEVEALLPAPSRPARHHSQSAVQTVVGSALESLDRHRQHDLRSLALHEVAVQILQAHPERAQRALDVLARWQAKGDVHTKPLWDEWRRIIEHRDWPLAVEQSDRGQQLRQAGPLSFVLDEEARYEILRRYRTES